MSKSIPLAPWTARLPMYRTEEERDEERRQVLDEMMEAVREPRFPISPKLAALQKRLNGLRR